MTFTKKGQSLFLGILPHFSRKCLPIAVFPRHNPQKDTGLLPKSPASFVQNTRTFFPKVPQSIATIGCVSSRST
jgi:hypothetical protein